MLMDAAIIAVQLTMIALTLLLTGTVKGLIGLGLPTISMGLLGLIMTPVQAAALLVVPTLATNAWQLASGPALRAVLVRFGSMILPFCLGTVLSSNLLTSKPPALAAAILGSVLFLYAGFGLSSWTLSVNKHRERWLSPCVALLTGALNGATGVSVIPLVPYLAALELQPEQLIQVLGLSFTVLTLTLAACLAVSGNLHWASAGQSMLALLPLGAGMLIGQAIRRRLSALTFKRGFFVGLLLLGTYSAVRGLAALQSG